MKSASAIVGKDGKMTMETSGYQGPVCEETIKRILEEMQRLGAGVDVTQKTAKPEYYAAPAYGSQYGDQY